MRFKNNYNNNGDDNSFNSFGTSSSQSTEYVITYCMENIHSTFRSIFVKMGTQLFCSIL